MAFDVISQNPTQPEYCQGGTLIDDNEHWCQTKFLEQYRLFCRYHSPNKAIVFAWVSDEDTKRAYRSSDSAHHVLRKWLETGHPPVRLGFCI